MPPTKAAAPVTGMVRRGHEGEQVGAALASVGTPTNRELQLVTVDVTAVARAGGRFAIRRNSDRRMLVSSSLTACCAAARVLLQEGYDPAICLVMRHEGSDTIALVAPLGSAAKLTVDENNGTRFARWKPFLRSAVSPAIAPKPPALTGTAGTAAKPMGEPTAETSAFVASKEPAEPMGQTAIEMTTTTPAITGGEPRVEGTTIAMPVAAESMIGSATIPGTLRKAKVVVTPITKQDAEEGDHGP